MRWLDEVYTLICDRKGRPYVKTHGFGVTSTDILYAYPFYTADSTTWLILSGHGRLQIPATKIIDGEVVRDYSKQVMLTVSPKSPRAKSPRQLIRLGNQQEPVILDYLDSVGVTREQIQNDYVARANVGINVFEDLVRHLGEEPVRFDRFRTWLPNAQPPKPDVQLKALPTFKMKLFYVAWANKAHDILRAAGMTNRLLSFFHIKDWTPEEFEAFMQTGLIGGSYIPRKLNGKTVPAHSAEKGGPRPRSGRPAPPASAPVVRRRERIGI
jgi:hypothetical protein